MQKRKRSPKSLESHFDIQKRFFILVQNWTIIYPEVIFFYHILYMIYGIIFICRKPFEDIKLFRKLPEFFLFKNFRICRKAARSNCWSFRTQGVKALKALVETNQLEPRRTIGEIFLALDQRVFAGKEDLIESLTNLALQADDEKLKLSAIETLISESERGNSKYKEKIFKSLIELCENVKQESRPVISGSLCFS